MENFSTRLRETMEKQGISAAELSRRSGVGKNMISYYMNGKFKAKQNKLVHIAEALNVDPGWLMNGVEQKVTVPDSKLFQKLLLGMEPEDYETVMRILEKTELAMRQRGEL